MIAFIEIFNSSTPYRPQMKVAFVWFRRLFLLLVPLACSSIFAEDGTSVRRSEDVIYGRKSGMALTLDVFEPAKPNGCGVIFLVNGGWLSSKATPLMVTIRPDDYLPYLERGYVVFAVVTSSQPKFTISEEMEDVHRAVRFVRTNAKKYGVRPNRLGILGSSSGGQLALSIATQGGSGKQDSTDPVERESSEVQAAACFFPPTDFLNYGSRGMSGVGEGPLAPLLAAFGPRAATLEERAKLGREISPIYFVTRQLPPTLIIHGDADKVVPLQQSESFVERAKSVGVQHIKLIVRPGKGHGWGDFWRSVEDTTEFVDWFDIHLRDRRD
jgi:acetyl esterase/lipase